MGNRTKALPALTGIAHVIREIRYHEFSRQTIGILLIAVYGYWCAPVESLYWPGAALAMVGILFRLYASGYVMKNKELATTGPYALVRHPLYTGNILMLAGYCLANGQIWPWVVGAAFLWIWYPTAIEYEDRKLNMHFGESWREWSSRTPALVPRSFAGMGGAAEDGTRWSFAKSMKQNLEPVIVVYSIAWLWWMWKQLPVSLPDVLS
jgi:protein-S-isoprenylcysteine O-methyltransferase Ste14